MSPDDPAAPREFAQTRTWALRVPLVHGEATRRKLLDARALRLDLKLRRDGDTLLFPIHDGAPDYGFERLEAPFETIERGPRSYHELLAHLPQDVRDALPTSFDIIGDVLIVKIPPALTAHERVIAEALREATPRIRTVAHDMGVQGELRTRALRVIVGDDDTVTEHVEHGVKLRVDPATCYFSPRLAGERRRVADLVQPGEHVVDLMGGVAPFALVIARHSQAARIDAVDLNAAAVAFARENVIKNAAADRVFPAHGDARAWSRAHEGIADRVITNLPHGAHAFVAEALRVLKPTGGVWHYHCIREDDALDAHLAEIAREAATYGRTLRVLGVRVVRAYSPREKHFAVDFAVA